MYLSGLTTATDASSPVSMPLSNVQIWPFLFEVMDNYASICAANASHQRQSARVAGILIQLHTFVIRL